MNFYADDGFIFGHSAESWTALVWFLAVFTLPWGIDWQGNSAEGEKK